MAGRPQPPPPPGSEKKGGLINNTKSGFKAVGSAGSGLRNQVKKLDEITLTKKGFVRQNQMSAGNVSYDRDTHVVAAKQDVSAFAPPPKKVIGSHSLKGQVTTASSHLRPATATKPGPAPAPAPAAKPAMSAAASADTGARSVPPPPPARASATPPPPPAYSSSTTTAATNSLTSKFNSLKAPSSSAAASGSSAAADLKTASAAGKTVGSFASRYGNSVTAASNAKDPQSAMSALSKAPKPTLSELKAGAGAARDLNRLHAQYAPPTNDSAGGASAAAGAGTGAVPGSHTALANRFASAKNTLSQSTLATGGSGGAAAAAGGGVNRPPPPLPPTKKPPVAPREDIRVCVFDFEAQATGDLTIQPGDQVVVLEKTGDEAAWWRGRNQRTGDIGVFPANYTKPA